MPEINRVDTETDIVCLCGSTMKTVRSDTWNGSDLGCYWLECSTCGAVSTPAISLNDAIWIWHYYVEAVNMKNRRKKHNANKKL